MTKKILFFDSGIGGLSTLAQALKICPTLSYIYLADNKHAPFGKLTRLKVLCHTKHCLDSQIKQGEIGAVVLACNTATNCALSDLQKAFNVKILGVEPAVKPAIDATPTGKILVLATPTTMAQQRFKTLVSPFKSRLILAPQPTLASAIENHFSAPTLATHNHILSILLSIKRDNPCVSALVLGCTHYSLIKPEFEAVFGVPCFDSNASVATELLQLTTGDNEFCFASKSFPQLLTTVPTKTDYTKILRQLLK